MMQFVFIFTTFLFVTAMVGLVSAKIVKNSDMQNTLRGYFLAGNGLGGVYIAGSMLLTNISAENLVGLAGQSYGANMSGMAWESTAVLATLVMAFIFLPLYLRKGYTTLPEFMEDRYGVVVRRIVAFFFLFGYLCVGIPVSLYAGAIAFSQVFNLSTVLNLSSMAVLVILIVSIGVIGALYAIFGGLKAVAVSDTINGLLLIIGSVLVIFFGFSQLGHQNGGGFFEGINQVLTVKPEKLNAIGSSSDPVPFATIFTGMFLANMFYWGTNQVLIQRALGAKNLAEGQKGVLLSGFLKMLVPLLLVVPGVIATHLFPALEHKDFSYPTLVAETMPWPIKGFFAAALFGAIISTYNSFLNSASTIFMVDIYKPIFNPNIKEGDLVTKSKLIGTGFAIFSIVFTPFIDVLGSGLYDFGRSFTGFYNIPIIMLVLVGVFSKKGSPLGAVLACVFHAIFYSGYKFWFKAIDTSLTNAILQINYLHIYTISFVIMLAIMFISDMFTKPIKVFNQMSQANPSYDMKPWHFKNSVAIWLVAFLIYEYFIFSPWGVATTTPSPTRIVVMSFIMIAITIVLLAKEYIKLKKTAIKQN